MRILDVIPHYVGSLLANQHPLFSCCASCGEIRTPVGNRLCTSLSPAFSVDVVYFVPDDSLSHAWLRYSLRSLEYCAPWVHRAFLVMEGELPGWLNRNAPDLRIVPHDFFSSVPEGGAPEAYLHLLPELEEHHVLLSPSTLIGRPCLVQDFYTPNGIPLLFISAQTQKLEAAEPRSDEHLEHAALRCLSGLYAQTKSNAAGMDEARTAGAFKDAADMTFEERRAWWMYTQGRTIAHVPNLGAGFSPNAEPQGIPRTENPLFFQGKMEDVGGLSKLTALLSRPSRFEVA